MIEVSHIRKKYGAKQVLCDISFRVQSGENVAIVGKNGCGKSTLLQVMAGILKHDAGQITYYGEQSSRKRRNFCGYVPQENPLMEQLSVRDNLRLWGGGGEGAPASVLQEFELQDILDMQVEKLSGGMKRRLCIACAALEGKPILLLDEPTTSLDLYYKEKIQMWLASYRKKNGIIVMTTHEEEEILGADRCFVMQDGQLQEIPPGQKTMTRIRELIGQ